MTWLTLGLVFCLLCTTGMTTDGISGDILKAVIAISICLLIHFINK